ncbi:hypothetical protein ABI59_19485 [Acidobacteria bacterium Mor1]|nr:hypothetical protein ABI59_19485 [Acidobacteria bacterium Mor1]
MVFAKLEAQAAAASTARPVVMALPAEPEPLSAPVPWRSLSAGAVAGALAHAFPLTAFLLSPLVTLLHEFGHAVVAWLLGCPAIPAFDFVYGGGVTHHQNFQLPIGIAVGGIWAWLGWTFRRNPRTLVLVVTLATLWLVAISSDWRREIVIASAGHLGELVLGAALLGMAIAGVGWRVPEIERPLGAFAGVFVLLQTGSFAWRLRSDAGFLQDYMGGKGGALMNDLELIALDVRIWLAVESDVPGLAGLLILCTIVSLVLAVASGLFAERLALVFRSLRRLDR